MTLTVGSLFSGIGGMDLGLERAGMKVIWQCEIDPYASRVLKKHWPDVPNIGDITKVAWHDIERPDLLCGGYPCQPFSSAGLRKGLSDPRHLWPWVADAIGHLRPRFVLLENVRGHLTLGGTSVIGDLACLGYDAEWRVISAASVGACHRRDRLYIVAYSTRSNGADTEPHRLCEVFAQTPEFGESAGTTPPRAHWWQSEPGVGRVADGISSRMDRLRGLGNAVVPQVAEHIGRMILNAQEK